MWLVSLQRAGLDTEKLLLCQPDSGEMALEVVDQTVRSSAVDIICVDSVAALVPRSEIEGEMGAHQGGMLHGLHWIHVQCASIGDPAWQQPDPGYESCLCLLLAAASFWVGIITL